MMILEIESSFRINRCPFPFFCTDSNCLWAFSARPAAAAASVWAITLSVFPSLLILATSPSFPFAQGSAPYNHDDDNNNTWRGKQKTWWMQKAEEGWWFGNCSSTHTVCQLQLLSCNFNCCCSDVSKWFRSLWATHLCSSLLLLPANCQLLIILTLCLIPPPSLAANFLALL